MSTVLALGCAAGASTGLSSASAGAAGTPAAPATACDPENLDPRGDFDGDGSADIAVGVPGYQDGTGAVDLRGTHTPPVVLTAAALGVGTGVGDGFGAAIAIADLDFDGCADLVIAAPAQANFSPGQVYIVFGSRAGVDTGTVITLPQDSGDRDSFGDTLALVPRYDGKIRVHDLYVGAPGAAVDGHDGAGEVFRYTLTSSTSNRLTVTPREVRSENSPGVPGTAQTGDGFGTVLASNDRDGVLVGAPNKAVGSARQAGAVWFLRVNTAGKPITSQSWSQNSPGVPGTAQAKDNFGAAIGGRAGSVVVGVPGEKLGSQGNAGMVQVFTEKAGGALIPGKSITQDTPGIPGVVESGDDFGAAVAVGDSLLCSGTIDAAVGAPGEDVGAVPNAGTVTLIDLSPHTTCPAVTRHQGAGLAGAAETEDGVGSVLGLTRGLVDLKQDYADRLLLGVPNEDIGAVPDAGMVEPIRGNITADGITSTTLKFSPGYLFARFYGTTLSSPSD